MIFRHACPLNSLSHIVIVFWFDSAKVIYLPQITQKKRIFLFEITRIIKTTTD